MRANGKLFWLALAAINAIILYAFALGDVPQLAEENGILETLQALVIASAMALFLWTIPSRSIPTRAVAVAMSFVCFSFFFREVDLRRLDVPSWVVDLTSGTIRNWIFLGQLAVVSIYLVWRLDALGSLFRYAYSRVAVPLYPCAALLVLGAAIDKDLIAPTTDPFWEEFAEINAYFALLVAAIGFRRQAASWSPNRFQSAEATPGSNLDRARSTDPVVSTRETHSPGAHP